MTITARLISVREARMRSRSAPYGIRNLATLSREIVCLTEPSVQRLTVSEVLLYGIRDIILTKLYQKWYNFVMDDNKTSSCKLL
ncbi:hypothetical protein [Funiculus sociatus]|uniref:hypothetical protein n=1 Tax=Funiculus sociatus TaxID=450527 RepID=UPI00329715F4